MPTYEIVIEPEMVERNYWRDLWRFRELFEVLAWRDIAIRYKQTVFGVAWAILRPLLTTIVFTVLFGRVARMPAPDGLPYAVLVFAGMLPWMFFSTSLSDASNSLIANANLISKVYFPRLIVPVATIVVSGIDFLVSFGLMALLMAWYGVVPGWQVVFLPAFMLLGVAASLGPALLATASTVKYRDLRFVMPFAIQLGLYVSPVGFDSRVVPEKWRLLYDLNPIVGVIDGFRWSLFGGRAPLECQSLGISVAVSASLLWLGIRQFRRMERSFADLI